MDMLDREEAMRRDAWKTIRTAIGGLMHACMRQQARQHPCCL